MTRYTPKYWNHKGKYEKTYNLLYNKLVPNEGEAETELGEILRLTSRIYYDVFNNGGWNIKDSRWKESLVTLVPSNMKNAALKFSKPPKNVNFTPNDNYFKFMDKFLDWVICYVDAELALQKLQEELGE